VKIKTIYDGNVFNKSPAQLTLNGQAMYPFDFDASIVNYPNGVLLQEAAYSGTWVFGPGHENIPQSIEIVFKPTESDNITYVFNNSDGECSFGPGGQITNFTAYLNGALVTDLDDIKFNQWNHLVLTLASPTDDSFFLNTEDGSLVTETISYMLLSGYEQELQLANVTTLFGILCGIDKISVIETALAINEGIFDNGFGFNYYSYAWAIIGAGGK
jgi:hypothetical protein